MAFKDKILSWRFHPLNIVGCCSKEGLPKGGHGHPRTPPGYVPGRAKWSRKRECIRTAKIGPDLRLIWREQSFQSAAFLSFS